MKQKADLIVTNGDVFTVAANIPKAEAFAVKNGKIVAIGTQDEISAGFDAPEILNLKGKIVYPGFIDAHCHFFGYALGLQYIDLSGCASFDEVIQRLQSEKHTEGKWLVGRGWDQNLWTERHFPDNVRLNQLYPNNPVMLIRVDGHVVLANEAALEAAKIDKSNSFANEQVEIKNNILTGILSETAADKMRSAAPVPAGDELSRLLKEAERRCFAVGLTTVSDAGLDYDQVMVLDSMQKTGALSMQIYAMLTPNEKNICNLIRKGIYQTDNLVARSIKIYADGSLGSRTARLKKPYSDAPGQSGIIVTSPDSMKTLCRMALDNGYQVNTHCIGDSAVSLVLNIYADFLKGRNDLRWRIEHAQVVDPADIHLFGDNSIIPSVQATHATSDMNWAENRLGHERIKDAYAYKSLMNQNGWLANGTDFPIENISPLLTFYAAVSRKDLKGFPEGGFEPENALSREEALQSITIWAAKANFMEKTKGSLEVGKDADFVILDQDILHVPIERVPSTHVENTYIKGVRMK
ncbi:MAG: amidohydrolase [Bacteroidetes bacterium]|nr:amidohydrolase [Bacteroidota bacterium]